MLQLNPFLLTDAYKVGHHMQYPEGTQNVYSNLTPRQSRLEGVSEMVFFGLQYFCLEYLQGYFNRNFFERDRGKVMDEYKRTIRTMLGGLPSYDHIEFVHQLGYLPLHIKALPEGTPTPMKVPVLTITNTKPECYWLTNFVESFMSCALWQPCTSATIAHEFRKTLEKHAKATGMPMEFVCWQGHDFSFRGMSSPETALLSGMAHLLSFTGTDTIPAIAGLEQYYMADAENELVGGSVAATEHAVMSAGGKDDEFETFKRLITEIYPAGIVSVVSDTWDIWTVLTDFLPRLKPEIMARAGKLVIRPDSGDPVKIICGDPESANPDARKGVVQLLWDAFGGTVTDKGYKLLDTHVGAIYGDSINRQRAEEIGTRLAAAGFASQVVFGIGSFSYQYNTRDTFGTAMKATRATVNGEPRNLFKSPVTDDGMKKSATGLLAVHRENGKLVLHENVTPEEEATGELQTVFLDGKLIRKQSLAEIRALLASYR